MAKYLRYDKLLILSILIDIVKSFVSAAGKKQAAYFPSKIAKRKHKQKQAEDFLLQQLLVASIS